MGMDMSAEGLLGGFGERGVLDSWFRGLEYDCWVALCIEG